MCTRRPAGVFRKRPRLRCPSPLKKPTFRELEHEGWMEKADAYDGLFAIVTRQAIPLILNTFGDISRCRLLDVCCGTGHLTAAAAALGAESEGIDFSAAMITRAKANYPVQIFREGDAVNLPYADAGFDGVACALGLHHLDDPEKGILEAYRVLKPGGRYTFTVWADPEQGHEFNAIIINAIKKHGTLEINLPSAPPDLKFSEAVETHQILYRSGFEGLSVSILPLWWETEKAEDVMDLIYRSIVRIPLMLNAQTESARTKINLEIIRQLRKFETGGRIRVPFPAIMVSAQKPAR